MGSSTKIEDGVWYPYTQMKDWSKICDKKIIESGQNFYFQDKNGNKYLDGIANMWCNVWGFGQNEVTQAMINQIKKIPHSTLFGIGNTKAIELSEKMLKITKGMNKVFFSDNGSSAIEVSLKIAVQFWNNKGSSKRSMFLSLKDGYHGDTFGSMAVGYVDNYFHKYKDLLMKCRTIPKPNFDYNDYNIQEKMNEQLEKTEKIIEKNSEKTFALIMESGAQIAGGVLIYPE
ncbi:MAG: aminotransferase class III-fold pyridoxal phosphate-dependent enzyme, partial [Nitrosopumilus sp.]|nr:aminotransferase class III-fold pyridoxal phosphate-dependent enzyme [Nitrosopumilus sp.]